ncbi:biotin-dependent carboxyltransferase family protein [Alkalibacillus salilacus]|uniref:Biotin-dependent carboxylase-like uncharacterized protein n=1 Tax=Alkalibacillus salilacus TaxID=284582 RepID=A0ABT9VEF6_9BACI|nr:biotin-dependent carboxyltransferase family protein [Alkalibacillus salilacus]MDQ0159358.1 biotin-dependent carboxylase-like uncharacterized protein [Alkalibacillus salilacus]
MTNQTLPLLQVDSAQLPLTVQDSGRPGYQHLGIPVSGAMDRYALITGNQLLNNDPGYAALEITLGGVTLTFTLSAVICVTGADLNATLDGENIPSWQTIKVECGQTLSFERPVKGARAYLCVSGGIVSDSWLDSQSVFEKGQLGRKLTRSDQVYATDKATEAVVDYRLSSDLIPEYTQHMTLRVILSPYAQRLSNESLEHFFQVTYTFRKGDRMGCQLHHDQPLIHQTSDNMVSDVVSFGTIQVPASGQPMMLLADRQTTGGYTTIGTVITADHWKCAQLRPGSTIRFQSVSIHEADQLLQPWKEK